MHTFLDEYASLFPIDKDKALHYIKSGEHFETLTNQWYECLDADDLASAYGVYNDDYYFTDLWTCFTKYSRQYLKNVRKHMNFSDGRIIDLGCGIGYTTAALKETYPNCEVFGTNIIRTKQWDFCERMASKYGFRLVSEIPSKLDNPILGGTPKTNIVFASEYFEHIYDPILHLEEIVSVLRPECFIIANAFNTRSIGHFKTYSVHYEAVDQSKISRMFNNKLRDLDYTKQKMPFFNNKPNVWRLQ